MMNTNSKAFHALRTELEKFAKIPDEEWEFAKPELQIQSLKKGEYFLQQGGAPDKIAFVNSGLLRSFKTAEDGSETTVLFSDEKSFGGSYQDFLRRAPSQQSIIAEEPTELVVLSMNLIPKLESRHPSWTQIRLGKLETIMQRLLRREHQFQNLTAEERYEDLLVRQQTLADRVDQWKIASYIGVSPEALSRIRKRRSSKS